MIPQDIGPVLSAYIAASTQIVSVRQHYIQTKDLLSLEAALAAFVENHCSLAQSLPNPGSIADLLLKIDDDLIQEGEPDAGICFIRAAETQPPSPNNKALLYLRLAEHHLEKGETEAGKAYLIKLCTDTVDNYEEAIALNELTPLWEKYKPLVAGEVPPSVSFRTAAAPLPPETCTMQIGEILALPQEEILSALSAHLAERSANGSMIQCLNQWEKTAFYADELVMEVNSGGFDSYLYYHGMHFEKAFKAMESISAACMLAIMDSVRRKFPKNRIPKTERALQNTMDAMEELSVDFEPEDEQFCTTGEKELLDQLLAFVLENSKRFR